MNQILENFKKKKNDKKTQFVFFIFFYFSIIALSIFTILTVIKLYKAKENEQISKKLTESYTISTLYSDSNNINYSVNIEEENEPFVIRNN